MKRFFVGALILSVTAIAADPKPLISKSNGAGFMAPEHAGFEQCDVYADRVVITRQYGMHTPTALRLVEMRKAQLTGDVKMVVEKAVKEEITEKPNGLCDGPSSHITANAGDTQDVLLFTTGGCGSPKKERTGIYSSKLRQIVDLYCPKTYVVSQTE